MRPRESFPNSGIDIVRQPDREKVRADLRAAMQDKITIITPEEFLSEFVPTDVGQKPENTKDIFEEVEDFKHEKSMYEPIMTALNKAKICPGYTFVATPHKGDKTADTKTAVDGALYPTTSTPKPTQGRSKGDPSSSTKWTAIEMCIECKASNESSSDLFDESKPNKAPTAETRQKILGQILAYAQYVYDNQHRTFQFMLLFLGTSARIVRIDRAGIFATKMFDYKTDATLLTEFLWRLAHLSPEKRGHDSTAKRISHNSADGRLMRAIADKATDDSDYSWRVLHDEIRKEGAVLELLNANDVLYVPTLVCHGDLGQKTTSEDVWRKFHPTYKTDDPYPLKQHGHYRLVVEEVGKPLEHFANGLELILALCCCLIAHAQAYRLGIIHRDISAGNILLYPAGNGAWSGILNDWELAKDVNSASPTARQPVRTGTWQFLSARALNLPESEIIIQDELESVFHVLLDNVGALLYYFFDDCHIIDKKIRCGMTKMHSMKTGEISFWQKDTEIILEFYWQPGSSATHPIGELLRELLVWFKAYYAVTNSGPGPSAMPALQAKPVMLTAATLSLLDRVDVDALFGQKSSPTALAQSAPKPTGSDTKTNQEIADKLRNHVAMIKLFQMYLDEKSWPAPGVDKTKDQRPKKGFNPSDHIRDSRTLAKASKRPADDDDAEPVTPPSKHRRTKATE